MAETKDLREVGERIEALTRELGSVAGPRVQDKAEELVRLVLEFYGAGLSRILEMIRESGEAAEGLWERFAEDELVASLLVLHGLHPVNVETRVARALDRVRPYLGSHGGDVKLLGIEDGLVRLRLEGSCDGCPSSAVTMKLAVERAIEEAAPEVSGIEVEGTAPSVGQPAPSPAAPVTAEPTIGQPTGEWVAFSSLSQIASGEMAEIEAPSGKIIVCKVGETLYSYRNACPSCSVALEEGSLRDEILRCGSCGRGYNVRLAGQCEEARGLHLEPLPLLVERDAVKIAVPTA